MYYLCLSCYNVSSEDVIDKAYSEEPFTGDNAPCGVPTMLTTWDPVCPICGESEDGKLVEGEYPGCEEFYRALLRLIHGETCDIVEGFAALESIVSEQTESLRNINFITDGLRQIINEDYE